MNRRKAYLIRLGVGVAILLAAMLPVWIKEGLPIALVTPWIWLGYIMEKLGMAAHLPDLPPWVLETLFAIASVAALAFAALRRVPWIIVTCWLAGNALIAGWFLVRSLESVDFGL